MKLTIWFNHLVKSAPAYLISGLKNISMTGSNGVLIRKIPSVYIAFRKAVSTGIVLKKTATVVTGNKKTLSVDDSIRKPASDRKATEQAVSGHQSSGKTEPFEIGTGKAASGGKAILKYVFVSLFGLILTGSAVFSQTNMLTLEEAQQLARNNYPLIKQKVLLAQTEGINISNLSKGYLPQFTINGQASYQSEVTYVSIPNTNIKLDPPEKDQYKIYGEATQLLYDGGRIHIQKEIEQLTRRADDQQVEVELYKVRQRISSIYLSILYLDAQLKQINLVREDILIGIKRTEAQVNNGVAFRSSLSLLRAELLKTGQRQTELEGSRLGLVNTLAIFIGRPLTNDIKLQAPPNSKLQVHRQLSVTPRNDFNSTAPRSATGSASPPVAYYPDIARPEIQQFIDRSAVLGLQEGIINSRNWPKLNLFLQGGYGRPALNMLKNAFEAYYIGGIRLNWNLGGFYTARKDKQLIAINQTNIRLQEESFVLNTRAEMAAGLAEIAKLEKMIDTDDEIMLLRNQVREASKAQLDNGVITASDYLREINAADQAAQAKITHEIQLMQAKINYQNTSGVMSD
jgi:outer membrane protein TolC